MAKYYTLIVKLQGDDQDWSIQFGSYDKQDCEDEREDSSFDGCKTKIITTMDDQDSINAKVAELNNKE